MRGPRHAQSVGSSPFPGWLRASGGQRPGLRLQALPLCSGHHFPPRIAERALRVIRGKPQTRPVEGSGPRHRLGLAHAGCCCFSMKSAQHSGSGGPGWLAVSPLWPPPWGLPSRSVLVFQVGLGVSCLPPAGSSSFPSQRSWLWPSCPSPPAPFSAPAPSSRPWLSAVCSQSTSISSVHQGSCLFL